MFSVLLMDSVGGNPANTLLTFTNPVFGIGTQSYTFNSPSAFSLASGTTYWLVLHSITGYITWQGNLPSLTPTGPGATHFGVVRFSVSPDTI